MSSIHHVDFGGVENTMAILKEIDAKVPWMLADNIIQRQRTNVDKQSFSQALLLLILYLFLVIGPEQHCVSTVVDPNIGFMTLPAPSFMSKKNMHPNEGSDRCSGNP